MELGLLIAVATFSVVAAGRVTRLGAWLLVPELAWITYLLAANGVIVAWN